MHNQIVLCAISIAGIVALVGQTVIDARKVCSFTSRPDASHSLVENCDAEVLQTQRSGKPIWITTCVSEPKSNLALQAERGYENLLAEGLNGWEAAEGDVAACWKRDGDELVCTGAKGPWIRYGKPVKDFNLRLEYLVKEGGNSGVYIRVPADGNHHGEASGIEVQILDDASPRYAALKPYQYSGSLYAIVPADPRSARSAGKWSTLEIDCKADQYIVWQNGVEVIRATGVSAPELLSRRLEGYIGLQNHSEEIRFRNIRLGASQH